MNVKDFGRIALLLLLFSSSARAALREAWVSTRAVRDDEVAALNQRLGGVHDLTVQLADPAASELAALVAVQTRGEKNLVLRRYPAFDLIEALVQLGSNGWKLVILEGIYPTESDVGLLNQYLRASPRTELTIGVATFAGPDVLAQFGNLHGASDGRVRAVFATSAYPRFMDRDALRAAPAGMVFQFYQDYWLSYVHMDVMNMLPQTIELRVRDIFPSDSSTYGFLQHLQRLRLLRVEAGQGPWDEAMWDTLGAVNVEWLSTGYFPTARELDRLADSRALGFRILTLDYDQSVSPEALAKLSSLPIPVRWIRTLP